MKHLSKNPASDSFIVVLINMGIQDLINFIIAYDQYVAQINQVRDDLEEYDVDPLNIEEFYYKFYKKGDNKNE